MKKKVLLLLAASFTASLIVTSCADPRKNCNHPQHYQYVKEKRMKRTGF